MVRTVERGVEWELDALREDEVCVVRDGSHYCVAMMLEGRLRVLSDMRFRSRTAALHHVERLGF